jgi:hypothetical protein
VNPTRSFETPFGLELLSTVHWVIEHEGAATPEAVIARTHGWNERKKRFSRDQILLAYEILTQKGWIAMGNSSPKMINHAK